MHKFKSILLAVNFLLMSGVAIAANAITPANLPVFPAAAEIRANQINAKISPVARTWLQQEAARESTANDISEATARTAIGGSPLDLTKMSVEDAILVIMMMISNDARDDMRKTLEESKGLNAKKNELREEASAKKADVKNLRLAVTTQQDSSHGLKVDGRAIRQKTGANTANDQGEPDQAKIQGLTERMKKANETAANVLKKSSETSSAMAGNIK